MPISGHPIAFCNRINDARLLRVFPNESSSSPPFDLKRRMLSRQNGNSGSVPLSCRTHSSGTGARRLRFNNDQRRAIAEFGERSNEIVDGKLKTGGHYNGSLTPTVQWHPSYHHHTIHDKRVNIIAGSKSSAINTLRITRSVIVRRNSRPVVRAVTVIKSSATHSRVTVPPFS